MIRDNLSKVIPNINRVLFKPTKASEELSLFYETNDRNTPLQHGEVIALGPRESIEQDAFPINNKDTIIYSTYYADIIEDTQGEICRSIHVEDIHAVIPSDEVSKEE